MQNKKKQNEIQNKRPKVTVIIPVYNADRYLGQCIESVLGQTLDNLEIICIDDCSDDKSPSILKKYQKSGIKVITLKEHCGQSHARNAALKEASGEYIGFVDADDFIDKTMYEKLYKCAKKNKADIEMCEGLVLEENGKPVENNGDYYTFNCFPDDFNDRCFNPQETAPFIEKINVTIWNKIYKTEFLKNSGTVFSEGYVYEDLPFFFEIFTKAQKVGIIREKLYFYRLNSKNSTMTETGKKVLDRVDMIEKTLENFKNLSYYEKIKLNIVNWIINDLFYRYSIIEPKYQKEYFFKMKKFLQSVNAENIKEELVNNIYYPQFCEVLKSNYEQTIQYFSNKDILYKEYIENIKNKMTNELNAKKTELQEKYEEIIKSEKEKLQKQYYVKIYKEEEKLKKQYQKAIKKEKDKLWENYKKEYKKEQEKINNNYKTEVQEMNKTYSEMLKEQINLHKKNMEKINSGKKKINLKDDNMEKPIVSVILPVYNVAPYLRQSLDSIINQTLKNIEIICIDDGSTDESGKILDEYKEKDERIKVVHKKNCGTGAARNDGLKLATGECIGFVDPDDWILPNMYERLYTVLKEKNLDIVMFTPDVFNDETQKHEGFLYFQNSNFPDFLDNRVFSKNEISPFSYPICVWNKLYTKKLFDDNNIDFAEGLDFEDHKAIFKSLFTAERIYFIREKLYVYRHSRKGSILSDNDKRMFDHIKIYDIVENILKETNNWEKFHFDFLQYKVHNILYYYSMIKPQYKKDYYDKMVQSLRATPMTEEEIIELSRKYPDLKKIMKNGIAFRIKQKVRKILNKD